MVGFWICKPVVSIADLYNQYHGKGIHKSKPVEGGVAELQRQFGNKWQMDFDASEKNSVGLRR